MRKTKYRGKYPRRIRTLAWSPEKGHYFETNDGKRYVCKLIDHTKIPGDILKADFDTLIGIAYEIIKEIS